jgi:hypothetical protein
MMLLLLPLNPSHSTPPFCWSNPVSKASTLIPLDPTNTPLKLLRVESRDGNRERWLRQRRQPGVAAKDAATAEDGLRHATLQELVAVYATVDTDA